MRRANFYETPYGSPRYDYAETKKEKDFCCLKLLSSGRMGRTQYFLSTMGITIFGIVLVGLLSLIPVIGVPLALIYLAGMLVFNLFFTIQRCHDINASGWLCLTSLIPFLSSFLYFMPGTKGINKYGFQPTACCSEAKAGAFALLTLFIVGSVIALSFYEHSLFNPLDNDHLIALVN